MQIIGHPAPGLGDLLAGSFVVPQNPIDDVTYIPRIGEILPASFKVPQNPIKDYMSGVRTQLAREPGKPGTLNGVGMGDCGCGGSCGGCSGGLGTISEDFSAMSAKLSSGDYMGAINSPVFGIPLWGIVAGAVAVSMFMQGRKGRR